MFQKIQLSLYLFFIITVLSCHQDKTVNDPSLSRDEAAYQLHYPKLKESISKFNININQSEIYLRAFKAERILEIWIKQKNKPTFQHFKSYPFCQSSGTLGPKRKEGDYQIPEGFYHISVYNPTSNFHLSLGLNYPNAADKILSDPISPGSDIYIHGGCMTIGCIPITDDGIKELYTLAKLSYTNGQEHIPVHIFPFRMNDSNLNEYGKNFPQHNAFWKNLQPFYKSFNSNHTLNIIKVTEDGTYKLES